MIACSLRTDPSGRVYCYTHDSPTVPLRPTCGGVMERVAPAELRAECAAVPTFAQVCVGPDASGGEFMCAECLAAAI